MKSLILCEGKYDLRLLGYYIHKISHERFCRCDGRKKSKLLKNVKVPVLHGSDKQVEIYCANDNTNDIAAIYASDGKSNLLKDIKDLCHNSIYYPEMKFDTIVILTDRDESDIESNLKELEEVFLNGKFNIGQLQNNRPLKYSYHGADGSPKQYEIQIIPLIIPFSTRGTMETVLVSAIAAKSSENSIVVDGAIRYIEGIKQNPNITSYLNHTGQIHKAKYSAVISVLNPDHGSGTYDDLLMSIDWENHDVFNNHFSVLRDLFS